MKDYYDLLKDMRELGDESDDRTGTGTISSFGHQMQFDLRKGFPLLTAKKVHMKSIIHELLWFLKGDTNLAYLHEHQVSIWDEWADESGDLGPVYGRQWRWWETTGVGQYDDLCESYYIDQIKNAIDTLKTSPRSRRIIVSAWNVADLPDESVSPQENVRNGKMALAPCHLLFQFYARKLKLGERGELLPKGIVFTQEMKSEDKWHEIYDGYGIPRYELSCQLYQRSADLFLGVPFNIASYALLTHMVAHICNMTVGRFIHTIGDAHIYRNHLEQVDELLSRDYTIHPLPTLKIKRKITDIDDFKFEDFEIVGYNSFPAIKAPVAV